jgi:hypothetical protein
MSNPVPMTGKQTVQCLLAWILLLLYAGIASVMIRRVYQCGQTAGCDGVSFGDGVIYSVTTIGALVSALVVGRLAVADTTQGDLTIAGLSVNGTHRIFWILSQKVLVWTYIVSWLAVGLAAFIVGVLLYPRLNQSVADIGTAWLGVSIAAAYAYFGIKP